jgi:hypothetical protein
VLFPKRPTGHGVHTSDDEVLEKYPMGHKVPMAAVLPGRHALPRVAVQAPLHKLVDMAVVLPNLPAGPAQTSRSDTAQSHP